MKVAWATAPTSTSTDWVVSAKATSFGAPLMVSVYVPARSPVKAKAPATVTWSSPMACWPPRVTVTPVSPSAAPPSESMPMPMPMPMASLAATRPTMEEARM